MNTDPFYKVESFEPMTGTHVTIHTSLFDAAPTIAASVQDPDTTRTALYQGAGTGWKLVYETGPER